MGFVSDKNVRIFQQQDALPTPSDPGTRPGWTQVSMGPAAGALRGMGPQVEPSPRFFEDRVMFACAYYDIMVSRDRGRTWDTVLTLPHTLTTGCSAGCAVCTSAEPSAKTCVECKPGYTRVATSAGASLSPERVSTFVCAREK